MNNIAHTSYFFYRCAAVIQYIHIYIKYSVTCCIKAAKKQYFGRFELTGFVDSELPMGTTIELKLPIKNYNIEATIMMSALFSFANTLEKIIIILSNKLLLQYE